MGKADPTVIVGTAGGYVHYRLKFCDGKVTVETFFHDVDGGEDKRDSDETYDTVEAAWRAVGRAVGWF